MGVGFEPTVEKNPTAVFETAALDHYATPPVSAPGETRTHSLNDRNVVLYPLSYGCFVPVLYYILGFYILGITISAGFLVENIFEVSPTTFLFGSWERSRDKAKI